MPHLNATDIISVDLDWDSYDDDTGAGTAYVTLRDGTDRDVLIAWGKATDGTVVALWSRSDDDTSWLDNEADRRWIRETFVTEARAYCVLKELIESQPWVELDQGLVDLLADGIFNLTKE